MWIMMTSSSTRVPLERHLRDDVLPTTPGVHWDQIRFFEQGLLPCFDNNGRFLLASKCSLATAPGKCTHAHRSTTSVDGNGGMYAGLRPLLPELSAAGIRHVHVYCVDNILCRVADPVFIAFSVRANADCANKVLLV
jgi:UDP-N-acetylglucosamine/UDP-N-acetylgalactosamine diphosphorylase